MCKSFSVKGESALTEDQDSILEIENMDIKHEGRGVLFRIEKASIEQNGIILLLGRNGAGKSSLIRQIVGLVKSSPQELRWNSKALGASFPRVGYVPEFPVVAPGVKAREWISWYNGVAQESLEELAPSYLRHVGFSASRLFERQLSTLSKGELQLVQIWQQFFANPDIGIFDEPFSGLDPWHKKTLITVLLEMAKHFALVITTHEIPEELRTAARRVWLIDENKFAILSPQDSPI